MADSKLTPRQQRAIAALLSNRNLASAAKAAEVSERTLFRWLATETFKIELFAAEDALIDFATRRLLNMQDLAIDVLQSILKDEKNLPLVRLRAVEDALNYLLKLREIRDMELRIERLEAKINARKTSCHLGKD